MCWIAKIVAGHIESDSNVFFLFIQTQCIFNVPLGSTTYYCSLQIVAVHVLPYPLGFDPQHVCCVAYTDSIAYTTSSVVAGMRGAKADVSPPRRSPPCTMCYYPLHPIPLAGLRRRTTTTPRGKGSNVLRILQNGCIPVVSPPHVELQTVVYRIIYDNYV